MKVLACSERVVEKVMGPPQRGLVHSAFSGAANLIFANDFLLSLNSLPRSTPNNYYAAAEMPGTSTGAARVRPQHPFGGDELSLPLMPNGLLLSARTEAWPFSALKAGMPVVLGVGWLAIEAISCSLDCTSCPRWNPRIERPALPDIAQIRASACWLTQFCQHYRPAKSDGTLIYEAGETILALAARVCGRGRGLTPSGDDFLAGWLAVGWLLYGPQPAFLASCQRINEIARLSTHALSQCWLAYAAAGDVARPIGELLAALTDPNRDRLERASENVLVLGATSGYDLLQGILYGIERFPLF